MERADVTARLDEMLDDAPVGFVSFGDDGIITLANATLLDMLGHGPGELAGRHVETILTLPNRIFYQTHFFPLVRLHGRADEIFLVFRAKSGEEVGALVNARRRERDGVVANDCAVMRVRERRKYEDELLRARNAAEQAREVVEARERELERQRARADEANQAKSAFLATMSHELRTPLNAIGGYAELIELGIHGPITDAQREALARIQRSQRHLLRLINDVLNLARIEAGRVEYALADAPLADLVAGVTPMIEPQLGAKALTCEVRIDPGLVVRADRDKARQIVLNLLTNAVKFTPAGGRVTIDGAPSAETPDSIVLRVSDTGIGIAADELERVFEPFTQVDTSHTRQHEGTGLGLAISRDLARGMGGDLTATAEVGVGSTFTLVLPRAAAAATAS